MLRVSKENQNKKSLSHARSSLQERDIRDKMQAILTRGSGSGHDKLDVKIPGLLRVECKNTTKKSYKLKLDDLKKMYQGCKDGEVPFMEIEFIDEDSKLLGRFVITGFEVIERYILDHGR